MLAACAALTVLLAVRPCDAQRPPLDSPIVGRFLNQAKASSELVHDLATVGGAADLKTTKELLAWADLLSAGVRTGEFCIAAADLVQVYELVRAPDEKKAVASYINWRLAAYASTFDASIVRVSKAMGVTTIPGVAILANKLKEQLRATQALFNSTHLD